jgi:hypothetical protein
MVCGSKAMSHIVGEQTLSRYVYFNSAPFEKASFQLGFCKTNNPADGGIHLSFAERGGLPPLFVRW